MNDELKDQRYYELKVNIPDGTNIETFVENINKLFTLQIIDFQRCDLSPYEKGKKAITSLKQRGHF